MKKELTINIYDYISLELLYLLMNFSLDKEIEKKIKELIVFIEKQIYGDLFKDAEDFLISSEEFKINYTFEK